jgi:hypothetical protein
MTSLPIIGDLRSAIYVLCVGLLLGWRFERWIKKHLATIVAPIITQAILSQVTPILNAHTKQIAALDGRTQKHSRQITQMVQAGEGTVAAAATWFKSPPTHKERQELFFDWRGILGSDDLDSKD